MSRAGSEERIRQRCFSNAPGLCESSCAETYIIWRRPVCIENDSPRPIADRSPIRLQHAFSSQLPGAEFLILPEDVAPGVGFLGQQTIGQANGFGCFTVVKRVYLDSSPARELLKNRLGVLTILRGVDNHLPLRFRSATPAQNEQQSQPQEPRTEQREDGGSIHRKLRWLKLFACGTTTTRTAALPSQPSPAIAIVLN